MVRPADESRTVARMSELRAVDAGFPLYGRLTLRDGQTYSHAMLEDRGVLVRPELLTALGVKVGDQITIGKVPFTIRGVITDEPGRRVGDFSLGPRVLIDSADLPATGLLTFGSRARHVLLVRLPDAQIDPLVTTLRSDFKEEFINARSYRSSDDEIGRDFDRAENYLSMVGLVIVILGGIAVSSVTRVFVLQKMHSIAVLKCTGATQRADHGDLHAAGDGAGLCRQRPGRCARPSGDRGDSLCGGYQCHLAARRRALRHHLECRRAGDRHRRARLAAVLGRAAAAGALGKAVAAAA